MTRRQAAGGAALTIASQGYLIVLKFLSGIILARLLTPADFGLIAMAASWVALAVTVQDLGLSSFIIYHERITQTQLCALYCLAAGFNLLLALTMAASSPLVAWFFNEPRLIGLTMAFGLLIFINGSGSIFPAVLTREGRYKALAVIDVLSATVGAIVGVSYAWAAASYWAIFAVGLASSLIGFTLNFTISRFRFCRPSFQGSLKQIISFSSAVFGFNIVNYFARNADNLLIGRFYGAQQLGLYDRAYQLFLFPLSQFHGPLGRVILPVLSRVRSDARRYREAYFEIVSLLMTLTQPGLIFAIAFASDVFSILFGQPWLAAAPIFQWLGMAGIVQTLTSTTESLFLSQGRGTDYFSIGVFNGVVTVGAFFVGLPWGATGVAIAYCIANYLIILPATSWMVGRKGPVKTLDIAISIYPHALAVAVDGAIFFGLTLLIQSPGLLACLGLFAGSYLVYVTVLVVFPSKRLIGKRNSKAVLDLLASRKIKEV